MSNSRIWNIVYCLINISVFTACGLYLVINYDGFAYSFGKLLLIPGNIIILVVYLVRISIFLKPKSKQDTE